MRLTFFGDTLLDRVYRVNLDIDDYILNMEAPLSCIGEPAKFKVKSLSRWILYKDSFGKIR